MSAASIAVAPQKITDGPTRYYLTQALSSRQLQLFYLEGRPLSVRIDAVRALDLDGQSCHRWAVLIFTPSTGETSEWFYQTESKTGSTVLPEE